jgi:hypothetical protein
MAQERLASAKASGDAEAIALAQQDVDAYNQEIAGFD